MSEKEHQILEAAEEMFAAGRYHEVTLDGICERAGVGKGTIYRYFEDKEDLYYQVILSGLDELVASVREVGKDQEDPGEGLRETARCLTGFYAERRSLFSLMWSGQLRGKRKKKVWKKWRKKSDKIVDVLAGFIRRGLEEGCYALEKFSPAAAARLLSGMLRTGMRHRNEMPGGDDWAVGIVDLFEAGLLCRNGED